jgi:uncharacterized 2Fe-2S/4Fe-4S cluster protein (DUF4445 family)
MNGIQRVGNVIHLVYHLNLNLHAWNMDQIRSDKRSDVICLSVLPLEKKLDVQKGMLLLDALRQAGIEISSPCNGQGLCGKCKVRIEDAARGSDNHQEHLTKEDPASGIRLACKMVAEQNMQVTLLEDYSLDARILEGGLIRNSRICPAAKISNDKGRPQLSYHKEPVAPIADWQEGFSPKGMAVDLGTTTLVVTLIDLQSGNEMATASAVNPQTRFGHDVMTRIHMASTDEGLSKLAMLISRSLNELVAKTCRISGVRPHEIVDVVIGGNTTMLQIAASIDPSPLGVLPFTMGIEGGRTYKAELFRLNVNPRARVYIPPVAHAFVGSDISAGLLSIDFFKQTAPLLFIDIGTNGEMALIADGHCVVTSTAAGPAFEGMGISHGLRASAGAIEMVWTNGDYITIRTIGNVPAKGICGSGIVDLMACLIRTDAVDPSGRLKNPRMERIEPGPLADRFELLNRVPALKLADNVYFTQKDIRQFQLAKSAIRTGVDLMLRAAGVQPDQLGKIVIAGAFGHHLREESLRCIGIVPRGFKGPIDFAGNTCRTGCALMLVDATKRDFIQDKMKRVSHLSIAERPDFQSLFVHNFSLNA